MEVVRIQRDLAGRSWTCWLRASIGAFNAVAVLCRYRTSSARRWG